MPGEPPSGNVPQKFHTACRGLPAFSPFRGLLPMDKAAAKRGEILQRTGKPALFPHIP